VTFKLRREFTGHNPAVLRLMNHDHDVHLLNMVTRTISSLTGHLHNSDWIALGDRVTLFNLLSRYSTQESRQLDKPPDGVIYLPCMQRIFCPGRITRRYMHHEIGEVLFVLGIIGKIT
jgi:hypothetical protein